MACTFDTGVTFTVSIGSDGNSGTGNNGFKSFNCRRASGAEFAVSGVTCSRIYECDAVSANYLPTWLAFVRRWDGLGWLTRLDVLGATEFGIAVRVCKGGDGVVADAQAEAESQPFWRKGFLFIRSLYSLFRMLFDS